MDKPRVKPLAWTQAGCAETPFGKYHVLMEDWSGQDDFWFVCFAGKPYGKCGEHGSEEAAKAAAQADYEARILAAIEPALDSVREAARVLLDAVRIEPVHDAIQRSVRPAAFCVALRAIAEGESR